MRTTPASRTPPDGVTEFLQQVMAKDSDVREMAELFLAPLKAQTWGWLFAQWGIETTLHHVVVCPENGSRPARARFALMAGGKVWGGIEQGWMAPQDWLVFAHGVFVTTDNRDAPTFYIKDPWPIRALGRWAPRFVPLRFRHGTMLDRDLARRLPATRWRIDEDALPLPLMEPFPQGWIKPWVDTHQPAIQALMDARRIDTNLPAAGARAPRRRL
jgi:hypothetical protein